MHLFLALVSSPSIAATLTVAPSGGADYTSLSVAITAAATGDTLSLASGTYTGPFDTDGKRLVINGAGASRSILTAGATQTVFTVENGESVSLSSLALSGALQGLEVRGSDVVLSNVEVTEHSGRTPGSGAGVYEGGILTISGGIFARNQATATYAGGGIYASDSSLFIDNTTFIDNAAGQGGALYADNSVVELTDVSMEGNIASTYGGGIRIRYGATLDATRLTVNDNTAGGRGGGISAYQTDVTITDGTFSGNRSGTAGGGIHVDQTDGARVTIEAELTNNTATSTGGGIHASAVTLDFSGTLTDNVAGDESFGGGMYAMASDVFLNTSTVSGNQAGAGGGIYSIYGGSLSLDGSTLENNEAILDGGAIYTDNPLVLSSGSVVGNIAGANGGGLAIIDTTATVSGCAVTQNSAIDAGGGLFLNDATLAFSGVAPISDNVSQYGAGIAATGTGTEQITFGGGQSISGNVASREGGGVFLGGLRLVNLDGCVFSDNDGSVAGGAARLTDISTLSAYGLTVTANRAEYGAGFHLSGIRAGAAAYSVFRENIATAAGGALLAQNPDGTFSLHHLQFVENAASEGAALYLFNDVDGEYPLSFSDIAASSGPSVSVRVSPGAWMHHVSAAHNDGVAFETDAASATAITLEWNNTWDNTADYGGALPDLVGTNGNGSADPDYAGVTRDGNADNDLLIPGSNSAMRDAGDPAIRDLDGSAADPGHLGGPDAIDQDYDGDGFFISNRDCDDARGETYPGAAEIWYDGEDNDCLGGDDYDADDDTYSIGEDCDDADPTVNPGATDDTADGTDQDCDGDDGPPGGDPTDDSDDGTDGPTNDLDLDRDGVPESEDCDDSNARAFPGNIEQCSDRVDNDCDGFVDEYDSECVGKAGTRACSSSSTKGGPFWLALLGLLGLKRRRRSRT